MGQVVAYFHRHKCHLKEALAGPKAMAHLLHVVVADPDRGHLLPTQAPRKVWDWVHSELVGLELTTRARSVEVLA